MSERLNKHNECQPYTIDILNQLKWMEPFIYPEYISDYRRLFSFKVEALLMENPDVANDPKVVDCIIKWWKRVVKGYERMQTQMPSKIWKAAYEAANNTSWENAA